MPLTDICISAFVVVPLQMLKHYMVQQQVCLSVAPKHTMEAKLFLFSLWKINF